jgi:hypothetical protein
MRRSCTSTAVRAIRLAVVAALLDRPDLAVEALHGIPDGAASPQTARLIATATGRVGAGKKRSFAERVSGAVRRGPAAGGLAASRGRTTWRD